MVPHDTPCRTIWFITWKPVPPQGVGAGAVHWTLLVDTGIAPAWPVPANTGRSIEARLTIPDFFCLVCAGGMKQSVRRLFRDVLENNNFEYRAGKQDSFRDRETKALMSTTWCTFNGTQDSTGKLRRVGLALMLLVVVLSSSKTASASCGDYLLQKGKPAADDRVSHREMPPERDAVIKQHGTTNAPEQAPVRRCNGPNCSKSRIPFTPMPSAPLSQVRSTEQAALLESKVCCTDTREAAEFPESERGVRYLPSSIFRPPAV